MKNILVTGGAGFIGSNFVRYVLASEPDVHIYNLDALTYAGSPLNLQNLADRNRHTLIEGNINDLEFVRSIFEKYKIEIVAHFAAESHVDRSIINPGEFIQTNIIGTFNLLESARQYWLVEKKVPLEKVRFHHVSTDEVFGSLNPGDPAWTENTPYDPHSPYSASKASSDHLVRAYGHTYGLPFTLSNCSNNYGPYQFPEKLIPLMIMNAASGKPLPVYGDGQQIRDWLYVEDHCEAIWTIIQKGTVGETYNIGGNNQPANLAIVEQICEIMDELKPGSPHHPHRNLISYVKDRPGHDRRYAMDITKIHNQLGWQPRHSLDEGLLETVKWYLDNSEWTKSILEQNDYQTWINRNYGKRENQ